MGKVYKATNTINGKFYLGHTINSINHRKRGHVSSSLYHIRNKKRDYHTPFHNAIRKYGIDCFHFEVIFESKSHKKSLNKEMELIAKLKPPYNVARGGIGQDPEVISRWWKKIGKKEKNRRIQILQKAYKKFCDSGGMKGVSAGEKNAMATITKKQVISIIHLLGSGKRDFQVSKEIKINARIIGKIRKGECWSCDPEIENLRKKYNLNKYYCHPGRKLKDKQIRQIRRSPKKDEYFAKKFGVVRAAIRAIRLNKTYKNVK